MNFNPFLYSQQLISQIRQNPAGMLQQAGLSIPSGMNDPNQILQHLLSSGQVPQQKYQQIMQMVNMFRR